MNSFVVTIDGPAGSGKSTVSAMLAKRLKFRFLTTGAFYRGLAILCSQKNADLHDAAAVVRLVEKPGIQVTADENGTQVRIEGKNVSDQLNSEKVAAIASKISSIPEVRKALLQAQREFQSTGGLIAEGRDCGTVVFPDAQVKIFLTANLDTRVMRRSIEVKSSNSNDLAKDLANRDQADTQRKVAPLSKAIDAVEIDTSSLSIGQVADRIEAIVRDKWRQHKI